jgi:hypothetical protein
MAQALAPALGLHLDFRRYFASSDHVSRSSPESADQ